MYGTLPVTQCHIPEEWNPQPHCCENLKTCEQCHPYDHHTGIGRGTAPCIFTSAPNGGAWST